MPISAINSSFIQVSAPVIPAAKVHSEPIKAPPQYLPPKEKESGSTKYWVGAAAVAACVALGIVGHKQGWFKKAAEKAKDAASSAGTAGSAEKPTEKTASKPIRNYTRTHSTTEIENSKVLTNEYTLENGLNVAFKTEFKKIESGKISKVRTIFAKDKEGRSVYSLERNQPDFDSKETIYDWENKKAYVFKTKVTDEEVKAIPIDDAGKLIDAEASDIDYSEFAKIRGKAALGVLPEKGYHALRRKFLDKFPRIVTDKSGKRTLYVTGSGRKYVVLKLDNGNHFVQHSEKNKKIKYELFLDDVSEPIPQFTAYNDLEGNTVFEKFEQDFTTYKFESENLSKDGDFIDPIAYADVRERALERLLNGAQQKIRDLFGL